MDILTIVLASIFAVFCGGIIVGNYFGDTLPLVVRKKSLVRMKAEKDKWHKAADDIELQFNKLIKRTADAVRPRSYEEMKKELWWQERRQSK